MVVSSYKDEQLIYNDGLVNHCVHYKEPKIKDLYLTCSCQSEIVKVSQWEGEEEVYFTIYSFLAEKYSLWERLCILFGGKTKSTEIILSKKEFNKLKKF
jgi:hypothetical protein